jgi:hypothetical protein
MNKDKIFETSLALGILWALQIPLPEEIDVTPLDIQAEVDKIARKESKLSKRRRDEVFLAYEKILQHLLQHQKNDSSNK